MKNKIILGLIIFSLIVMPFSLGTAPNPGHLCEEFYMADCEQKINTGITSESYSAIKGSNNFNNNNALGLYGYSPYGIGVYGLGGYYGL